MKKPEDTREQHPLMTLAEMLAIGTGSTILRQEARGQASFVGSDTLPRRYLGSISQRQVLEKAGVQFLGEVEGDDQFEYVKLPEGWKKVPTEHSMWSYLVDDKGRRRASIFYKAAFYDRSAHISLEIRYTYRRDWKKNEEDILSYDVLDQETVIWSTEDVQMHGERGQEYYDAEQAVRMKAEAWLDKERPDWQNPGAYWD